MVRHENDKLIIELDAPYGQAAEDLLNIQKGIIELVRSYNFGDFPVPEYMFAVLDLLNETLPTVSQLKEIFKQEFKEPLKDI